MKRFKMLKVGNKLFGYTIVEAMIFLAVSGGLLVASGTIISGRQEKTRFTQAVDDVGQNLQDIFNDTSTGYYPTANNIRCLAPLPPPAPQVPVISSGAISQGTNSGCTFMGKLIEFPLSSATYRSYTMVTTKSATALSTSSIKLLGAGSIPGIADTITNNVDLRTSRVTERLSNGARGTDFQSLAVISDLGNFTSTTVTGNASKLRLYGYTGTISASGDVTTANLVPILGTSSIVLCLAQGGTDLSRRGSISISPQLTVDRIIGSQDPVCA
jgi:hypothetical protein